MTTRRPGRGPRPRANDEFTEWIAPLPRTPSLLELFGIYDTDYTLFLLCGLPTVELPDALTGDCQHGRTRGEFEESIEVPQGMPDICTLFGLPSLERRR